MSTKESHYLLINPYIEGGVPKLYKASSPENAAKDAWLNISKYFAGKLPNFHITLSRPTNGALHHFSVKESKNGKNIDFSISPHVVNLNDETLTRFKQHLEDAKTRGMSLKKKADKKMSGGEKKKQLGGKPKKHEDEDSSSSDDDEVYLKRKKIYADQPIVYFWYDPSIYGVDKIWFPSLLSPLFPPIEWSLSYLPYSYILPRVTYP